MLLEILDWMRWQDWAGNGCYALLALSYVFTNMFWLRTIAIASLSFESVYFYFASAPPLWVGIAWNFVFVAINVVMLVLLLRERAQIRLSAFEALLHRGLFGELDALNFSRLLKIGRWIDMERGVALTREGGLVDDIYVLADGLAEVAVGDRLVSILQNGAFVGEISLLTDQNVSPTVVTISPCRLFAIEKQRLTALLLKHPEIRQGLDRSIGRDLARKLRATSGHAAKAV